MMQTISIHYRELKVNMVEILEYREIDLRTKVRIFSNGITFDLDKLGREKINVEIGAAIKVRTREPTNKLGRLLSPSDSAPSSLSGKITKYALKTWREEKKKSFFKSINSLVKKEDYNFNP